jgi:hypothetical protein
LSDTNRIKDIHYDHTLHLLKQFIDDAMAYFQAQSLENSMLLPTNSQSIANSKQKTKTNTVVAGQK